MAENNAIERVLLMAKSKSELHRAIDALPDDATLIIVANACCCGDPTHSSPAGSALYHAAYGEPSVTEALGLMRLAEHRLLAAAFEHG